MSETNETHTVPTDKVFDSLSKYAVANVADKDAYKALRESAAEVQEDYATAPDMAATRFKEVTREAEDDFLNTNYGNMPYGDVKHLNGKRAGQWKYRKLLPKSYSSAKSVLIKGLEAGIDVFGKAKTELERERRTAQPKSELSPDEQVSKYLRLLIKAIEGLPTTEERSDCVIEVIETINTRVVR